MKINKLNYENYVIDYIEGTLSIELKKDFDLFLEKNVEVYEEIKDYISAPILEESNEIFTDKKSISKAEKFNPYFLLAIIPFLLLGAYFLLPNQTASTPTNEIKTENIINQFAQEDTTEPKQELNIEEVPVVKKDVEKSTLKTLAKKKTKEEQVVKKKEVFFASNDKMNTNNVVASPMILKEAVVRQIKSQDLIQDMASLKALPLNVFESKNDLALMNGALAIFTAEEKGLKDQLLEKSAWLEMITPASFADIDLKESLAIESNLNINTSRKILNAFIPESLVK